VLLGTPLGLVRLEREAALVLSLTGSAAKVGIVTFAFGIPFVLFALLARALLDRVDRKRVMIAARDEPGPFGTLAATFPNGPSYQP
jgi:MFS family permease